MTKIKVTEDSSVSGMEEAPEKIKESGERQEAPDWETRLQEKEKEARENYDRYLRLSAELENYKKRMEKEKIKSGNIIIRNKRFTEEVIICG